jgi:hypothetical protein
VEKAAALAALGAQLGTESKMYQMASAEIEKYYRTLAKKIAGEQGFLGGIQTDLKKVPDIIAQALTGGGGMSGAIQAIASMLGKRIGGQIGEGIGKALGGTGVWGKILGEAAGSLLGPLLGKLFGPTDYEKRVRANADAVKQLTTEAVAAAGGMEKLRDKASIVGIQIDEAFKSRDAKWIEKILGDVEERTNRLASAMEKYGISWEDLGEKARQSKIDTMAEDLILDFEVLMSAGADVNFIIEKMGSSIQEFVKAAARTGSEVPESMRPMLQRMLEMGLLTDENGNAFTSLEESGIQFAETLTDGLDRVVAAIDRIAAALGYVFDEFDGRAINIPVTGGPEGGKYDPSIPTGRDDPIPMARGGDFWVTKPTTFLAGEAGPERATFTPAGQGGGAETMQPITINLEGQALWSGLVRTARRHRVVN